MPHSIPQPMLDSLSLTHLSWRESLESGLNAVIQANPGYLPTLIRDAYLPTGGRLFAAYSQPMEAVRFILVGEGPYPRANSATGYCFMDGAVGELWSHAGLSKTVNRATSLRNFMKMLLLADDLLTSDKMTGEDIAPIARISLADNSPMIGTLAELQNNLHTQGFLLLNATPVYRAHVPPTKEARAWVPFLQTVLNRLADEVVLHRRSMPVLVLWGKIAERVVAIPGVDRFPQIVSEHPYNLSFITNTGMQHLFRPMRLLQKNKNQEIPAT